MLPPAALEDPLEHSRDLVARQHHGSRGARFARTMPSIRGSSSPRT